MILQLGKSRKLLVEILFAIEPSVNSSPRPRCEINQREVAAPHQLIDWSIGFGEQVAEFHLGRFRRHTGQAIANASRSAIVALAEAGAKDKNSLFHTFVSDLARKFSCRIFHFAPITNSCSEAGGRK